MNAAQEFICDIAETISMPDIYKRIRKMMGNPQANIADYVKLFQSDSMLSLRIMRIVNSDFFGFNRPAKDLNEAIRLIGAIQLHDLYLSSLCVRALYNIPHHILNADDFWQHSIRCGITARTIAKLNRIPGYNRYFTIGLLLEIGHAVMYVKTPELAIKALLQSQQQNVPVDQVERNIFGFDYCQVGSAIMKVWHLPDFYPQIVESFLTPELISPELKASAEIANFAHRMCSANTNKSKLIEEITLRFKRMENLSENFDATVSREIREHADSVYDMFKPAN